MVPRNLSRVRFDPPIRSPSYSYPSEFDIGPLIFLGEIPNMPDHCVVVDVTGRIWTGYHTYNFVEE